MKPLFVGNKRSHDIGTCVCPKESSTYAVRYTSLLLRPQVLAAAVADLALLPTELTSKFQNTRLVMLKIAGCTESSSATDDGWLLTFAGSLARRIVSGTRANKDLIPSFGEDRNKLALAPLDDVLVSRRDGFEEDAVPLRDDFEEGPGAYMPMELLLKIFGFLPPVALLDTLGSVCKSYSHRFLSGFQGASFQFSSVRVSPPTPLHHHPLPDLHTTAQRHSLEGRGRACCWA